MDSAAAKERSDGNKMRAARLSAKQFEVLIHFMQQHPHFAVGRAAGGSYSKEEHDRLWKTLSDTLNETEGPMKSVTKWQKCWVDLKSNARSRAAKAKGKSFLLPGRIYTQWDIRVLNLLNEISGNENKFPPTVAQSPLQLVEVGLSEKLGSDIPNDVPRAAKHKFRKIAPKPFPQSENGYHVSVNGSLNSNECVGSNYNEFDDMHPVEDDVEELIAEVKSEAEDEWLHDTSGRCEEDYSMDSLTPRNESDSQGVKYLHCHGPLRSSEEAEEHSSTHPLHITSRKRKHADPLSSFHAEDSIEKLSKRLCGTLDRMATAAEKANAIQQGMVDAMNRLASAFELLLPIVSKVVSKHASLDEPS